MSQYATTVNSMFWEASQSHASTVDTNILSNNCSSVRELEFWVFTGYFQPKLDSSVCKKLKQASWVFLRRRSKKWQTFFISVPAVYVFRIFITLTAYNDNIIEQQYSSKLPLPQPCPFFTSNWDLTLSVCLFLDTVSSSLYLLPTSSC